MTHSTDHRLRPFTGRLLGLASIGLFVMEAAAPACAAAPVPPPPPPPAVPAPAPAPAPAPVRPAPGPATGPATAPVRVTRGTAIGDPIKRTPTVQLTLIQAFIRTEAALLAQPDLKVTPSPRATLERNAGTDGDPPASPAYQRAYAAELNRVLLPLFKNPDARVRLSAAIVTAKAAARLTDAAAAVALAPAATAALSDKAEPVVLWGVKAAHGIIPKQLDATKPDTKLADALIGAVKANSQSGAIIEDAYDAFTGSGVVATPARKAAALPSLINLLNARIAAYKKVDPDMPDPVTGEVPYPGSPQADIAATTFFATQAWTRQMPPASKQQIAQAMLDLSKEMVRLAPTAQRRLGADPPETTRKEDLIAVLTQTARSLIVIADAPRENKPDLKKAAELLSQVNPDTPDETLTERLTGLEAALRAANLLPAAPAGGPATAPVAGS